MSPLLNVDNDEVVFEIEGLYPIGIPRLLRQIPHHRWERSWKTWYRSTNLSETRRVLAGGRKLAHDRDPISYSKLRLIRVAKGKRKVIT